MIATLGLGLAVIPELYKAIKDPKSVLDISPLFLCLRGFFFILMAIGLFLKRDKQTITIGYLSIWYIIFYTTLLVIYEVERRKAKKKEKSPNILNEKINPISEK